MDTTEREGTSGIQPEGDTGEKSLRTPLVVRSLMFVLLMVVLINVYSEMILQPQAKETSTRKDLQKLGLAYHEFHRVFEHSPTSMDELKDFLDNPPPPPKAQGIVGPDPVSVIVLPDSLIKQVREGRVVVIWSAALTDSGQENDQYLLAYTAEIDKNGGLGLTAAGRAIELTAEAFQKFPIVDTEQTGGEEPETKPSLPEKPEEKGQE